MVVKTTDVFSKRTHTFFFLLIGISLFAGGYGVVSGYIAFNNVAEHSHPVLSQGQLSIIKAVKDVHTHDDFSDEQEKIIDKHFGDSKVELKEYIDGRLGEKPTIPSTTPTIPTGAVQVLTEFLTYKPGDLVRITGFGDDSTATQVFISKPSGQQESIANTRTTSNGEINTIYIIPSNAEPGIYTVIVIVGVKDGTASFQVTE